MSRCFAILILLTTALLTSCASMVVSGEDRKNVQKSGMAIAADGRVVPPTSLDDATVYNQYAPEHKREKWDSKTDWKRRELQTTVTKSTKRGWDRTKQFLGLAPE
jgi:hypothetical protein